LTAEQSWVRLRDAERAILCTTNAAGVIDAVPVCFAVVGSHIATPIDRVKPKRTTELARRANLERDVRATLLTDHWDGDDWSRLWWVRARLARCPDAKADSSLRQDGDAALRAKYPQYRTTQFADVIVFDVATVTGWSASDPASEETPASGP
jgi:PPOX class probable F420-dependent enzyme